MIVDERLVTYINSLDTGNTEILDEIEREALETYVPIVRKEMQSFLKLILSIKRPARILEVGTAVGFSAILMAEYNPIPCEITTIENYEKRIPIAKENFVRAGKEKQITLLEGDAADILKELREPFDFIFMDILFKQAFYLHINPHFHALLLCITNNYFLHTCGYSSGMKSVLTSPLINFSFWHISYIKSVFVVTPSIIISPRTLLIFSITVFLSFAYVITFIIMES